MNMKGLLVQPNSQPIIPQQPSKKVTSKGETLFQNVLQTNQLQSIESLGQSGILQGAQGKNKTSLVAFLMGLSATDKITEFTSSGSKNAVGTTQTAQEMIRSLMAKVQTTLAETEGIVTDGQLSLNQVNLEHPVNTQEILKEFAALFNKAVKVLSQLTDQARITKAAPAVLNLLEQWTTLDKKSNKLSAVFFEQMPSNTTKEQVNWKELVQAFQKRNQFAAKQQYNTDAKVTTADVAKWLQHAVKNQQQIERTIVQQPVSMSTNMPMTKVEQYVIHMNMNQTSQSADQQLIEQFQKVIKTSRFLAMNNGTSQLAITLRPENLGDMMVKLTQINGEMTVKIMVTSQAAKEMLESNVHQLKNMFAPQQVVIDKQEITTQQSSQTYLKEQDEQSTGGNQQDETDHSHQQNEQSDDSDFQAQFEEMLRNEDMEVTT